MNNDVYYKDDKKVRICNLTITELDNIDFDNRRVIDESKIIKTTKEAKSRVKYKRKIGVDVTISEAELEDIPMREYAILINSKWYYVLHRLTTTLYDEQVLKFKLTKLINEELL